MNLGLCLTPHAEGNSKLIACLNVKDFKKTQEYTCIFMNLKQA